MRPQDDLFRAVNGAWLAKTAIPADKSRYGTFDILQDNARAQLRAILDEISGPAAAGEPWVRQVGDFYTSFMDEAAANRAGVQPLARELAAIDAIRTRDDLAQRLAQLAAIGVRTPIAMRVAAEPEHPERYALFIGQGGLGMPNRDYYLREGAEYTRYREQYASYAATLLRLAGVANPAAEAGEALTLETDVAKAHWTAVETRDQIKSYNPIDAASLPMRYPGTPWRAWLDALGAANPGSVVVSQPSAIETISAGVNGWPVERWKAYLSVALLDEYTPYLGREFVDAEFAFRGAALNGRQENAPRWMRAVDLVDGELGESLGRLYVARHFSADAKRAVDRLVENLRAAFRVAIDEASWMQPATRREAQVKLARFRAHIGYPDAWRDYSRATISRDTLAANVISLERANAARDIERIGHPVDQGEWQMTPPTINAQYSSRLNAIFFPAGILQPPFFDPAADDAVNYGGIGAVIGHEMGHGFDDQGRKSDAGGRLRDWWTADDAAHYEALAARIATQYGSYQALPGLPVNGNLTLGENIGDLTGLTIALRAYRIALGGRPAPVIDGLTGEQRFFIGWAQVWRGRRRDDALRALVLSNPHSPEAFRTNGTVANVPAFYEAFGVKAGDGMWVPPDRRTLIW